MALFFRPGYFYAPKVDKKLVCVIWQWGCQCHGRVKLSTNADKFRVSTTSVGRAIITERLENGRTNLRHSIPTAGAAISQSVAVEEASVDIETLRKCWGLNEEQMHAVETSERYVRVVAGPGSGKTRVLTHRIAHMIACRNVPPPSILCITFTNKAAQELCERLDKLLDKDVSCQLTVGTIHSVCARVLRSEQVTDYHIGNDYVIYDNNDSSKVVNRILQAVVGYFNATNASDVKEHLNSDINVEGISGQNMDGQVMKGSKNELWKDLVRCKFLTGNAPERLELLQYLEKYDKKKSDQKRSVSADAVKVLLNIIRKARLYNMQTFIAKKNQRVLPTTPYGLSAFAFKMAEIYELELRRSNAADFDDLLYIVAHLLYNNHHIREEYRKKWRHVLVDEFQDIDEIQYALICLLSIRNKSLFVVGDIDQAIYAWRGANAAHLQYTLQHDFPNISTLKLRRNYRSSRNILKVASVLLKNVYQSRQIGSTKALNLLPMKPSGDPICIKALSSSVEEADFVALQIQRLVHERLATFGSCAILYRTHAQSFLFQSSLTNLQIPHVAVGETPFYSHKEIKYILAYLRLLVNCECQMSLESIINVPSRGIGEQTLARLKKWASVKKLTLASALQHICGEVFSDKELDIQPKARTRLTQFWKLIEGLQNLIQSDTIGTIMEAIIERTDFKSYLKKLDNSEKAFRKRLNRLSVLQTIGDSATHKYGSGKMALAKFLQEISLVSDQENMTGDKAENCVKLLTLHAAKGLEFETVFIIGLQAGLLSLQDENIDEERRLLYVGITRAIQRLYLTFSTTKFKKGKPQEAKPSLFIKEILRSPELNEVN